MRRHRQGSSTGSLTPKRLASRFHKATFSSGASCPARFISLRILSRQSLALPRDSTGRCRVCSMSRRIAEYQSAAVACCAARSGKRRKVWSPARIAAAILIEATIRVRGESCWRPAKIAVPTMLEKTMAGMPTI